VSQELYDLNHHSSLHARIDSYGGMGAWLNKFITDITAVRTGLVATNTRANKHGDKALTGCGLAIATTTTAIKVATLFKFVIAGVMYEKAITDNITVTACAAQPASKTAAYLITINASGTVKTTKGADGANAAAARLPAVPAGEAPIGIMQITTAASGTGVPFTAGTTGMDASGVSDLYYSLAGVSGGDLEADVSDAAAITASALT
jgi:hypothetical protein